VVYVVTKWSFFGTLHLRAKVINNGGSNDVLIVIMIIFGSNNLQTGNLITCSVLVIHIYVMVQCFFDMC